MIKLNRWVFLNKGKYNISYFASNDLKNYFEFGILFEKNPCFFKIERNWQLKICLGWFRLYILKVKNEDR